MSDAGDLARLVIEAQSGRDEEPLRSLYSPDERTLRPGWPAEGTVDDLVASWKMDTDAVPDLTFTIKNTGATDDRAATEVRLGDQYRAGRPWEVRSRAPRLRRTRGPGKGRPIDLLAVFVHEVEGGVIAAERQYWGVLEFLVQAGLICDQPASAST